MKILTLHPTDFYNSGDYLTYLGTRALLTKALGGLQNADFLYFNMRRAEAEPDTYVSQYCWGEDIDIIALAGSPWVWLGFQKTPKCKMILDAINRWPRAKKVGLGLGSCFTRQDYFNLMNGTYGYGTEILQNEVRRVFRGFDFLLTRDEFAKFLFDQSEILVRDTFDTSIYSYNILGRIENSGSKKILWFYDPSKGVSGEFLDFDPDDYIEYQLKWARENDADIYCNGDGDMSTLINRGVKGNFSTDLAHLVNKFTEYGEMLSGRVHMAVLGILGGISNITLLPVDSRFLTATRLGIKVKFIGESWGNFESHLPNWDAILKEEQIILNDLREIWKK